MIRIITDSSAEFSALDQKELAIEQIPLSIAFGDEVFWDRVDLSPTKFYEKLKSVHYMPKTSQPSPEAFREVFRKYLEQGDEIVGIFVSAKVSGTFQSAVIAAQELEGEIHLVDSKNGSLGLNVLVREAVKMRALGHTAKEIKNGITALTKRVQLVVVLETLKYLKKGGRISAATAIAGGMLGIKPIVGAVDGKVEAIGKARGQKGAFQFAMEWLQKHPPEAHASFVFGYTDNIEPAKELIRQLGYQLRQVICCEIGAVIGTYAGTGAVGFAYIAKEAT